MDSFSNRPDRRPRGPVSPRASDPLDQRLDRWMSAGRQLVDGVSGARPGGRPGARERDGRAASRPGFEGLGRWVEDRLDWLLEDEDDWREPWQQERTSTRDRSGLSVERTPMSFPPASGAARQSVEPRPEASPRRALEAVSRRGHRQTPSPSDDWPAPEEFQVNRWQRPSEMERSPQAQGAAVAQSPRDEVAPERRQPLDPALPAAADSSRAGARPLPRSSRRRD